MLYLDFSAVKALFCFHKFIWQEFAWNVLYFKMETSDKNCHLMISSERAELTHRAHVARNLLMGAIESLVTA